MKPLYGRAGDKRKYKLKTNSPECLRRLHDVLLELELPRKKASLEMGGGQNLLANHFEKNIPLKPMHAYALAYKYKINPDWLLDGQEPVYLETNTEIVPKFDMALKCSGCGYWQPDQAFRGNYSGPPLCWACRPATRKKKEPQNTAG